MSYQCKASDPRQRRNALAKSAVCFGLPRTEGKGKERRGSSAAAPSP